jgi:hypothetical protein
MVFDEAVSLTPMGRTLLYSCDLNQTAQDVNSFTRCLIDDAKELARCDLHKRAISIKEIFEVTRHKPAIANHPQYPTYDGGRRRLHIPFAVSV